MFTYWPLSDFVANVRCYSPEMRRNGVADYEAGVSSQT
ncbi:hypothetical protein CCUG62472_02089 [Mycobacteroides salmoniphilum]|nr:hypothetical protein CCUG62472_02089 [Mycobacteroides salmoniphilum]